MANLDDNLKTNMAAIVNKAYFSIFTWFNGATPFAGLRKLSLKLSLLGWWPRIKRDNISPYKQDPTDHTVG